MLISGTQSVTSQYVQTGNWSKTDWLSVGKEALIGGAKGFVTGYIGAGGVLTNALGKTATMAPLLNSTSTVTRVTSHAVIGSISQIGTGVTTRFAGSMLTNGFDIQKSAKAAFDLQGILTDGAIGGVFGGVQGLKKPQTFTSSQVQKVKGAGEGRDVKLGERIIPGTEGIVHGGDSTKLGKNMMESMDMPRGTKWTGYQAQHVIPVEMAEHPMLQKIGINLDDVSNGLFLRTLDDDISTMSRHSGYHSTYNEFVKSQLDLIDINQSVDVIQKQVYDLQQNLKSLQQGGLPLYPSQGATIELWQRSLERIQ